MEGFDNNDILVRWKTYNNTAGTWVEFTSGITEFTIGRNMGYPISLSFTNYAGYWIDWTGTPTQMGPGVVCTHYVYVTIFGSAPIGSYSAQVIVDGEGV